jgi:hypothetical protein
VRYLSAVALADFVSGNDIRVLIVGHEKQAVSFDGSEYFFGPFEE